VYASDPVLNLRVEGRGEREEEEGLGSDL